MSERNFGRDLERIRQGFSVPMPADRDDADLYVREAVMCQNLAAFLELNGLDWRDEQGRTALHWAALNESLELLAYCVLASRSSALDATGRPYSAYLLRTSEQTLAKLIRAVRCGALEFLPRPWSWADEHRILRLARAPSEGRVQVACFSDTHGGHRRCTLPPADILICSGDVTQGGDLEQAEDFLDWFSSLPHEHKILVPGNHDLPFLDGSVQPPEGIQLLVDRSLQVLGLKIYGSPSIPFRAASGCNCFSEDRDRLEEKWQSIPRDTELLVTHGPPLGIGDGNSTLTSCTDEQESGDAALRKAVFALPRLKFHVFGHKHAGTGVYRDECTGITFINGCQATFAFGVD